MGRKDEKGWRQGEEKEERCIAGWKMMMDAEEEGDKGLDRQGRERGSGR